MLNTNIISIVSEEIAYFLSIEKQAAIPGFGRFISVNQSAMIKEQANLLTPPSSKITFEPNLEESDTNFVDYFVEHHPEGNTIDNFVDEFIYRIKEENSVLLPELGLCILNKEGAVHFEGLEQSESVVGFDCDAVSLKPVPKTDVVTKLEEINAPGAAAMPIASNSRSKLIRIGMVLSSLVLLFICVSKFRSTEAIAAEFQKVPTNYNVSPQDQDVIVASMDGNAPSGEISLERKEEILERQRLMTEALPESKPQIAAIITNTFGNDKNIKKQLDLIAELGYNGSTLEKENGLTSTLITIEYQNEEEMDALFEEIKNYFHRAKLMQ